MRLYLDKIFRILSSSFNIGTLSRIARNISGSFGLYVDTYGIIFSSDFSLTVDIIYHPMLFFLQLSHKQMHFIRQFFSVKVKIKMAAILLSNIT